MALPRHRCGVGMWKNGGRKATDLKFSVRRQIDRLRELTVVKGKLPVLEDEIKRYELIYDMLDGRKKAPRQGEQQV